MAIIKELTDYGVRIEGEMRTPHAAHAAESTHDGQWDAAEIDLVTQAVSDLARVMGGAEAFRENLGGVRVVKDAHTGGLGAPHRVRVNAGGRFDAWTVMHELAHAWDGAHGWQLSKAMQRTVGARFHRPLRHLLKPDDPAAWYDPGQGPPPCGIDRNFNRKEDFAEAVTATVYPERAWERAHHVNPGWPYDDPARGYSYDHFHETPRGRFIDALMAQPTRIFLALQSDPPRWLRFRWGSTGGAIGGGLAGLAGLLLWGQATVLIKLAIGQPLGASNPATTGQALLNALFNALLLGLPGGAALGAIVGGLMGPFVTDRHIRGFRPAMWVAGALAALIGRTFSMEIDGIAATWLFVLGGGFIGALAGRLAERLFLRQYENFQDL